MNEFQGQKTFSLCSGLFLSALIKTSPLKNFTICTEGWEVLPEKIGYQCMGKNITVLGSVGEKAAQQMGGTLKITGNAGYALAHHMENGTVTVRGNVSHALGHSISSGNCKIIVYGEVESAQTT